MKKMIKAAARLKRAIDQNNLIDEGDSILIALSGGADSVLLTVLLNEVRHTTNISLFAAHVNHGIRGEAADRDEEFSRKLCDKLGIPFYSYKCSVPDIAKDMKLSEETVGRKIRYDFFDNICQKYGINKIATAHHMDDNAETVLMNMIRGAGAAGLSGIEYKSGNKIRPMLDFTKMEILDICAESNIDFCSDDTNFDTTYTRNNIRHIIIPQLQKINPSVSKSLVRQAEILSGENDFMEKYANDVFCDCMTDDGLDTNKLKIYHSAIQRRVIYLFIASIKKSRKDITFEHISDCMSLYLKNSGSKTIDIGHGYMVYYCYGKIRTKRESEVFCVKTKVDEWIDIPQISKRVKIEKNKSGIFGLPSSEVVIRSRLPGDVFFPVGMTGRKKVKDFLIDKKIPQDMRDLIPIVECNGDIVCVGELRVDRRFVKMDSKFVLKIENIL